MFDQMKTRQSKIRMISGITIRELGGYHNYTELSSRFFGLAAMLAPGTFIGLQISCPLYGDQTCLLFTDADIQPDDAAWVMSAVAVSRHADVSELPEAVNSGHISYILSECSGQAGECTDAVLGNLSRAVVYDDTLRNSSLIFQILAGPDGSGGVQTGLLVSCPGKLPVRVRTALAALLPGTRLEECGEGAPKPPVDVLAWVKKMAQFTAGLLCMSARSQTSLDKGLSAYEKMDIEALSFSIRTYNCLKRAGIHTVGQLMRMDDEALMNIRNFGRRSLAEVREKLKTADSICTGPGDTYHPDDSFDDLMDDFSDLQPEDLETKAVKADNIITLDQLVGLKNVKDQVRKITALARMKVDMEAKDMTVLPVNLSMAFAGNPGTAKTTVARILAGTFKDIGLLESSDLIEVGRADLVAEYVGQTAVKVKDVFRRARGKMLFIDEAYSLLERSRGDFGDEAINTIVQEMENHRDETIVIFAGYPGEMEEFLTRNPGLKSRVPFKVAFSDYSAEEMLEIIRLEAKRRGFTICPDAERKLAGIAATAAADPASGNGRFCRNLTERAVISYAARVYGENTMKVNNDFILRADDFTIDEMPIKRPLSIGFCA